jgi:hypothetical protein
MRAAARHGERRTHAGALRQAAAPAALPAEADERPAEIRGRQGARKQVAKRARQEHYPAPYAIIDQWQHYGGNTLAVPADRPTSLDALVKHPTTRNLIRVFFLQDRLKGFGKDAKNSVGRRSACTWSAPASWAATSPPGACCAA